MKKKRTQSATKFPIIDFSQQKFQLVQNDNVTIGDLETLAESHGNDPFIFYDGAHREVACVIPEAIKWAVQKFNLHSNDVAADTGIFKVLRRNQAIVHRDQPASRVAHLAASQELGAVIAVGDNGKPDGLFLPALVKERLLETGFVKRELSPSMRSRIHSFSGNLVQVIGAIETQELSFHSEGVNIYGGEPYICQGDAEDGPHIRNSCPCQYHPGSQCMRRKVFGSHGINP